MKKIIIILSLIIFSLLSIENVFANINNYFSSRLQNLLLQKVAIVEKVENKNNNKVGSGNIFISNKIIYGEIDLFGKTEIQPYLFITLPSGDVMRLLVDLKDFKINFRTPAIFEGKYQVEVIDNKGFPIFFDEIVSGKNIESDKKINDIYDVLADINELRKKLGLSKLEHNQLLQNIAIRKVEDMRSKNYIGHTSIDGKNIFSFLNDNEKKKFFRLGENVSGGYELSLKDAYIKILNSPAHRFLLLNSSWTKVGIAYVYDNNGGYFVQVFSD